jgi:N-acetylglutamate synthase-like GNAT family acetyltransferase
MGDVKLSIAKSTTFQQSDLLVEMINKVYLESEADLWLEAHQRISPERMAEVIADGELLIAEKDNQIAGCIHLERKSDSVYRFKMLVTNPKLKRNGIGTILVDYAERVAIKRGAKKMQLELLVTTDFIIEDKVFLKNWYTRLGYKKIKTMDVEYVHEGLEELLKTGCVAEVYIKEFSF